MTSSAPLYDHLHEAEEAYKKQARVMTSRAQEVGKFSDRVFDRVAKMLNSHWGGSAEDARIVATHRELEENYRHDDHQLAAYPPEMLLTALANTWSLPRHAVRRSLKDMAVNILKARGAEAVAQASERNGMTRAEKEAVIKTLEKALDILK